MPSPSDEESILKMASINKDSSRPLSNYQKEVNTEAGKLAVVNPSLLCKWVSCSK